MIIKANHIKNLSDARYFAALQSCKWLTFDINNSTELAAAKELEGWINGPQLSAYLPKSELTQVYQAFSELHLAAIDMDSGAYRLCKDELEVPVILRLHYSPSISYHYYLGQEDKIVAIVLEIDDIESVSSTHLQSLCSQYKTILKSKLSTEQLKDILTTVTPYGIELDGSSEVSLGLKSYDEINELIELIEAD